MRLRPTSIGLLHDLALQHHFAEAPHSYRLSPCAKQASVVPSGAVV